MSSVTILNCRWTGQLHILDFDAAVLSRLVRDMTDHFTEESERLLNENPRKNAAAKHRLTSGTYTVPTTYENGKYFIEN